MQPWIRAFAIGKGGEAWDILLQIRVAALS